MLPKLPQRLVLGMLFWIYFGVVEYFTYRDQRTALMWVLGIKLTSLGLAASAFTH